MAKIQLNPSPTFKGKVSIPVLNGEPAEIEMVFKHRGRKDFGALKKATHVEGEDKRTEEEVLAADVAFVMEIAQDWDLEHGFNAENVEKLLDAYHGAARAISVKYAELLVLGRLGN